MRAELRRLCGGVQKRALDIFILREHVDHGDGDAGARAVETDVAAEEQRDDDVAEGQPRAALAERDVAIALTRSDVVEVCRATPAVHGVVGVAGVGHGVRSLSSPLLAPARGYDDESSDEEATLAELLKESAAVMSER